MERVEELTMERMQQTMEELEGMLRATIKTNALSAGLKIGILVRRCRENRNRLVFRVIGLIRKVIGRDEQLLNRCLVLIGTLQNLLDRLNLLPRSYLVSILAERIQAEDEVYMYSSSTSCEMEIVQYRMEVLEGMLPTINPEALSVGPEIGIFVRHCRRNRNVLVIQMIGLIKNVINRDEQLLDQCLVLIGTLGSLFDRLDRLPRRCKSFRDEIQPAIRDQLDTPYCFLHSAAVVLEHKYFLEQKIPIEFSDQAIIDKYHGMYSRYFRLIRHGVTPGMFLKYFQRHPYVTTKDNYPCNYLPKKPRKEKYRCNYIEGYHKKRVFNFMQWRDPKFRVRWKPVVQDKRDSSYEDAMVRKLKKHPLVGFIKATWEFSSLKGEIYSPCAGPHDRDITDHVVALIGLGTRGGQDYYIVQNSYGIDWGVNGIGKIARGYNAGGIGYEAYYPEFVDEEDWDETVVLKKRRKEWPKGVSRHELHRTVRGMMYYREALMLEIYSERINSGDSEAAIHSNENINIEGFELSPEARAQIVAASAIPDGWMRLDTGPDSIKSSREIHYLAC